MYTLLLLCKVLIFQMTKYVVICLISVLCTCLYLRMCFGMYVSVCIIYHVCTCMYVNVCMFSSMCCQCVCVHLYLNEYVLTYMYHNSLLKCNIAALLFCIWYRYGSTCQVILVCSEDGNEIRKLQYYHHHFHLVIVVEVISDLGLLNKA